MKIAYLKIDGPLCFRRFMALILDWLWRKCKCGEKNVVRVIRRDSCGSIRSMVDGTVEVRMYYLQKDQVDYQMGCIKRYFERDEKGLHIWGFRPEDFEDGLKYDGD